MQRGLLIVKRRAPMAPPHVQRGKGRTVVAKAKASTFPTLVEYCQEEVLECPLCVEPFDETDRDFYPCPCGYQVCLFCYEKLIREYNGACPGCRTTYGESPSEGSQQPVSRRPSSSGSANPHPPEPVLGQGRGHGVQQHPAPPPRPPTQGAHQQHGNAIQGRKMAQDGLPPKPPPAAVPPPPEPSIALPQGATWGQATIHRQGSGGRDAKGRAARDDGTWPSLPVAGHSNAVGAARPRLEPPQGPADTGSLQQDIPHVAPAPPPPPPRKDAPRPPAVETQLQPSTGWEPYDPQSHQIPIPQPVPVKKTSNDTTSECVPRTQAFSAPAEEGLRQGTPDPYKDAYMDLHQPPYRAGMWTITEEDNRAGAGLPSSGFTPQVQARAQARGSLHVQSQPAVEMPLVMTIEVTSMVSGVRRSVGVPLPHKEVQPYPEAVALLRAVQEGAMPTREAARQLLDILRSNEVETSFSFPNGRVLTPESFASHLPSISSGAESPFSSYSGGPTQGNPSTSVSPRCGTPFSQTPQSSSASLWGDSGVSVPDLVTNTVPPTVQSVWANGVHMEANGAVGTGLKGHGRVDGAGAAGHNEHIHHIGAESGARAGLKFGLPGTYLPTGIPLAPSSRAPAPRHQVGDMAALVGQTSTASGPFSHVNTRGGYNPLARGRQGPAPGYQSRVGQKGLSTAR